MFYYQQVAIAKGTKVENLRIKMQGKGIVKVLQIV